MTTDNRCSDSIFDDMKCKAPTTTCSCNIHDVCLAVFPANRDGSAEISGRGRTTRRKKQNKKKTIHCRCSIRVLRVFSTAERKKDYFILMVCYRKAKIRPGLSHIVTLNHTVSVFFSFRLFYYYLYTFFRYYFFFLSCYFHPLPDVRSDRRCGSGRGPVHVTAETFVARGHA